MSITWTCVYYQGRDVPGHSKHIFNPSWVDKLARGVRRNYSGAVDFVCFTDESKASFEEDIRVIPFKRFHHNMLCILEVFSEPFERAFFSGLDTVIVRNIDDICSYSGSFAMTKDPNSPQMGCSGVMAFSNRTDIFEGFNSPSEMGGFPSDMPYLNNYHHDNLDELYEGIFSYKVHIRRHRELMDKARIIYFHGRLKPHEIDEEFVREHWI